MKKSFSFLASASIVLSSLVPATSFAAEVPLTLNAVTSRIIAADTIGSNSPEGFGRSMATGDFNADGHQDVAIGAVPTVFGDAASVAYVGIFYGPLNSSAFPSSLSQADALIKKEKNNSLNFGISLAAGDLNADGYDDLFIGDSLYDDVLTSTLNTGVVYFLEGSATQYSGVLTPPNRGWKGTIGDEEVGAAITVGDFNGDGKDDLAIGAPATDSASPQGKVYVEYSQIKPLKIVGTTTANIDTTFTGNASTGVYNAGVKLFSGKLNADGYADLIIVGQESKNAKIMKGKAGRWPSLTLDKADVTLDLNNKGNVAGGFAVGDFNGDVNQDLAIGDADERSVFVLNNIGRDLLKTEIVLNDEVDTIYVGSEDSAYGTSLESLDFDNNGVMDLAVGAPTGKGEAVYSGNVSVLLNNNSQELKFKGVSEDDKFGTSLHAFDVNEDGMNELFASAPTYLKNGNNFGMVAALFECVDADKDSYCAAGIGVNSAGRAIDSNDADANSEKTITAVEIPTVVSLKAQNDGQVKITYSDNTTKKVDYFTKTKGVPTVQKLKKQNRYVVYHPKMKSAVAVDATFGDTLDKIKLSKKKFSKGKGKVKKVGSTQLFLFVQMKNKKSSRFVAVKLDGTGSDNFFLAKKGKNLDSVLKIKKAPKVKKVKKGTFTVRLKDTEGTVKYLLKKPTKKFTLKAQD